MAEVILPGLWSLDGADTYVGNYSSQLAGILASPCTQSSIHEAPKGPKRAHERQARMREREERKERARADPVAREKALDKQSTLPV